MKFKSFAGIVQSFFGSTETALPFKSTGSGREVKLMGRHPLIRITPDALVTMHRYVDQVDTEIGWLGTAIKDKDTILIDQVFLFKQQVSGTTTRITADGLHEVAAELLEQGDEGEEIVENLRFWGHSHVEMECYPSQQDNDQMDEFRENGAPFFVRGIFNKKGQVRFDVYDYERRLIFLECKWEVVADKSDDTFRAIDDEIKEKISETPRTPVTQLSSQSFPNGRSATPTGGGGQRKR